jgi:type III restriction enzyme
LDRNSNVFSWVKNDHLGFEVYYTYRGVILRYRPDFLVRLTNGKTLVLEVKGLESQQDRVKRDFLAEWVKAVNTHGGFGTWASDVSYSPADLPAILAKANSPA